MKTETEAKEMLSKLEIGIKEAEINSNNQKAKLLIMLVAGINWAFDWKQPTNDTEA